jgi:hypothetical protein
MVDLGEPVPAAPCYRSFLRLSSMAVTRLNEPEKKSSRNSCPPRPLTGITLLNRSTRQVETFSKPGPARRWAARDGGCNERKKRIMVSKCKFLAVVLAGLAFVLGGRILAAEQADVEAPATQQARTTSKQKNVKAGLQSPTSAGKKGSAIQDQNPVSTKGKSPSKTRAIQDQVPVSSKTPVASAKGPKKWLQSQTAAPAAKKATSIPAPPASTPSKETSKGSAIQDQGPARPGVKAVANRQQAQTQSFEQQ